MEINLFLLIFMFDRYKGFFNFREIDYIPRSRLFLDTRTI